MPDGRAAMIETVPEPPGWPEGSVPEATAVIGQLARTHDLLQSQVGKLLRPLGLSAGSFTILVVLDQAGGVLAPSEISARAAVTRAGVTGLVDALERLGLVVREADPTDRRRNRVLLTDPGREMLGWLVPTMQREEAELMAGLSPGDQRLLRRLLAEVADHVMTGRTARSQT